MTDGGKLLAMSLKAICMPPYRTTPINVSKQCEGNGRKTHDKLIPCALCIKHSVFRIQTSVKGYRRCSQLDLLLVLSFTSIINYLCDDVVFGTLFKLKCHSNIYVIDHLAVALSPRASFANMY